MIVYTIFISQWYDSSSNHIIVNCEINIVCTIVDYVHTIIISNVHHLVAFLSPGIGYRTAVF